MLWTFKLRSTWVLRRRGTLGSSLPEAERADTFLFQQVHCSTSSSICRWFRCGDRWPFQAQISWNVLLECQLTCLHCYLIVLRVLWSGVAYIQEGLKVHTLHKREPLRTKNSIQRCYVVELKFSCLVYHPSKSSPIKGNTNHHSDILKGSMR